MSAGNISLQDHLAAVVKFAATNVPFYRDQAWAARVRKGRDVSIAEIPYTLSSDLKGDTPSFYAGNVPEEHGPVLEKFTSGSTGHPLKILKTALHFKYNARENGRLKTGWDFGQHRIKVRTVYPDLEHAEREVVTTQNGRGLTHTIHSFESRPIAELIEKSRATHLQSRPSVLHGTLLETAYDLSSLKLVSTVSESLSPMLLERLSQFPKIAHCDSYGTVETGIIAGKCAICGVYHLADKHSLIEVIGSDGRMANAGETGRIAITTLFNYAMPLIKYQPGDIVAPVLSPGCERYEYGFGKIVGRERHLFLLPNGARVTPNIAPEVLLELGVVQYKLVQTEIKRVELYYVTADANTELSDDIIQNLVRKNIFPGVRGVGLKVAKMPTTRSGKFLMHESHLA